MTWVFAVPIFSNLEEVLPKLKDQLPLLWNLNSATSFCLDQIYNSK